MPDLILRLLAALIMLLPALDRAVPAPPPPALAVPLDEPEPERTPDADIQVP